MSFYYFNNRIINILHTIIINAKVKIIMFFTFSVANYFKQPMQTPSGSYFSIFFPIILPPLS